MGRGDPRQRRSRLRPAPHLGRTHWRWASPRSWGGRGSGPGMGTPPGCRDPSRTQRLPQGCRDPPQGARTAPGHGDPSQDTGILPRVQDLHHPPPPRTQRSLSRPQGHPPTTTQGHAKGYRDTPKDAGTPPARTQSSPHQGCVDPVNGMGTTPPRTQRHPQGCRDPPRAQGFPSQGTGAPLKGTGTPSGPPPEGGKILHIPDGGVNAPGPGDVDVVAHSHPAADLGTATSDPQRHRRGGRDTG